MNQENTEELITFSEAARLTSTTPQNINDLINRKRLIPIVVGKRKFLKKCDVVALEKGIGGRPIKPKDNGYSNFCRELSELCERLTKTDEERFSKSTNFMMQYRKSYADNLNNDSFLGNPNWKRNKKKLRRSLKDCPMSWQPLVIFGDVVLTRMYVDPIVQDFFVYCVASEKMLNKNISVAELKHNFITNCENQLNFKPVVKSKPTKQTQLILALFKEGMDLGLDENKSALRTANVLLTNKELKAAEWKIEAEKILKILYSHNNVKRKSITRIKVEVAKTTRPKKTKT